MDQGKQSQAGPQLTLAPWREQLATGEAWELWAYPDGTPVDPYNDSDWLLEATFSRLDAERVPNRYQRTACCQLD